MGILDEIRAAADELMFEFSQSDWEDALIEGFKNDWTMGRVLAAASGVDKQRELTPEEWQKLSERAALMTPALAPQTHMRRMVRTWVAGHARWANDALWDGDYARAKRLFKKGGVTRNYGAKVHHEVIKENRETIDNRIFVSARANDRRRDWHVCK